MPNRRLRAACRGEEFSRGRVSQQGRRGLETSVGWAPPTAELDFFGERCPIQRMTVPPKDITDRLNFAVSIARQAGEITLKYFGSTDLQVDRKADQSPVTIADRTAEVLLRERIGKSFAADGIIGEEFGEQRGESGYLWIVDPIDGTKSFVHGIPLYTTLVAVLRDGEPIVGVIHAPALAETVYASQGGGCYYVPGNSAMPQPARVSAVERLSESLFLTTEIASFTTHRERDALDVFVKLQRAARLARTWGDGYGYLMVATGRAEIMIDPVMNLWDAAPLQTVIEEAGGQFTDWKGNPTVHAGEGIATNGRVTEEVLAITRFG